MKITKNSIKSLVNEYNNLSDYFQVRNQAINAHTEITPHAHQGGQLNIISSGIMEVNFEQYTKLVSPWQYAIWIPAGIQHSSYNKRFIHYCSIMVPLAQSKKLPTEPCMLEISEIARAIINDIIKRQVGVLTSIDDQQLIHVLLKQLTYKKPADSYLPMMTTDKFLQPILGNLIENPADNRTLKDWAATVFISEKTLARRFQTELNMSFREWRVRLRFLRAVQLLKNDISIQEVAYQVGYNNTSAFILMFSKAAGTTPEKYRKLNNFYQIVQAY